jgi:transcriptional regulator with XRE-family HTH domain
MEECLPRVLEQLGGVIRTRRKAQKLTQEEFASEVGLHRTYIADIERGRRNVSVMNLCRIATALRLSVSELFIGIETRLRPER